MIKKIISDLKFMDFCSDIGAGRVGLERLGLTCVWFVGFSEIDKNFERTYREFFWSKRKKFQRFNENKSGRIARFRFNDSGISLLAIFYSRTKKRHNGS